jgi:hypothetical protein
MPAKMHTGLYGEYKLKVLRPDRSVRWESGKSPNLIVTSGLRGLYTNNNTLADFGSVRRTCHVGSGSDAPALGQTSLINRIASKTYNTGSGDSSSSNLHRYDAENPTDYHIQQRITWQFSQGAAAGNLSEVGVGYGSGVKDGNLFSRALILDQNGNPTTITVLSDEFLIVEYRFSIYPFINGEVSGTVDGYNFRIYPVGATANAWGCSSTRFDATSSGNLTTFISTDPLDDPFDITSSSMAGTDIGVNAASVSNVNYDETNHTVIKRFSFSPTEGNQLSPNPIRTIRHRGLFGGATNGGAWAVEFTPGLEKDDTKTLTIDYLMSWGNYTPPEPE